jgi:hypothetical protein
MGSKDELSLDRKILGDHTPMSSVRFELVIPACRQPKIMPSEFTDIMSNI